MKETPFRILVFAFAAIAALTFGSRADAAFVLTITDGVNTEIITDNIGDDTNPVEGIIDWSGSVGDFMVPSVTGLSKPVLGDSATDLLAVVMYTGNSSGSLFLTLSDDEFDLPAGSYALKGEIGGTTDGLVGYLASIDIGPDLPLGPLGPGAFSASGQVPFVHDGSLFEMTTIVKVDLSANDDLVSFNAETEVVVPEPATLAYVGLSLGALGLRRRRRRAAVC